MSNPEKFLRLINNPFKLRLFLFAKLPAALFSGVRVLDADQEKCTVTVPFKWFTKNPFRSTYFACLSMAAEMSTGVLAMAHLYESDPPVSMLVTRVIGDFNKKSVGRAHFTCEDGSRFKQAIEDAIRTKESISFHARSIGKNTDGEVVAQFEITWSFKVKQ